MRQLNIFRRTKKQQHEIQQPQQESPSFILPSFGKLAGKYTVVVHIGVPGTGSAAIQKFLFDNHSKLKELGFYYPVHKQNNHRFSHGHSKLGSYLEKNDLANAKSVFDSYLAEAEQNNLTLLLSAESLYAYPDKLKELTLDKKCKIIAFFRDPLEAVYSNYNKTIKEDFITTTLEQFCHEIVSTNNDRLSGKKFEAWQDLYWQQNLLVLGYDPIVFEKTRIEMIFLAALGINKSLFNTFQYTEEKINPSLSFPALELRRWLNFVIDKDLFYYNHKLDWLLETYSEKSNTTAKNFIQAHISQELYDSLKEMFKATNSYLLKGILTPINPDFLVDDSSFDNTSDLIRRKYDDSQLKDILVAILENDASTAKYIINRTRKTLSSKNSSYYVLRLAELLGIDIQPYLETSSNANTDPLFTKDQLDIFLSKQSQPADFLREIAITMERHNDYQPALLMIERALELRPSGTIMKALHNKLKRKI